MAEDILSRELRIPCFMFDCAARLRPAAFMDIAQELAALGSERCGFADGDLAPHGLVWILARMSVRFDRIPLRLDTVTAQTWHRGLDGPFFVRDYRLLAADGTPAASSTSSWIIMDMRTRRIVRGDRIADLIPSDPEFDIAALPELSPRLYAPDKSSFVDAGERLVLYSDLDYNGHVNNARYTVWALDALPLELVSSHTVRSIDVNFNREVLPGSTVKLSLCEADGYYYVEGRSEGYQNFLVRIGLV